MEKNINWLLKAALKKTITVKLELLMQQNSTTILSNMKLELELEPPLNVMFEIKLFKPEWIIKILGFLTH